MKFHKVSYNHVRSCEILWKAKNYTPILMFDCLYNLDRFIEGPAQEQNSTPSKEHVASLIGLYKNSGAVSCVAINFLL